MLCKLFYLFFASFIIILCAKGIFEIVINLDKSPLSISIAFDNLVIFFLFSKPFLVSIFEIRVSFLCKILLNNFTSFEEFANDSAKIFILNFFANFIAA